ncbi:MAG: FtsX-like permease family protein [Flammeovirgaceae bacterium]|nr:FtsX-like permease family protein [Flammeovirgaceae bacterium]
MIKNYFLITLRSLLKNKLYVSINILGMAVAIACLIVGYYNYDFNDKFDYHHVNQHSIYRVSSLREFQGQVTKFGYTPLPLGNAIRENVKDIDRVVRYIPDGGNFRIDDNTFNGSLSYVDAAFFDVFSFEFIEGTPQAIGEPGRVLISEDVAIKYFGKEPALGKMITELLDSASREFIVGGVYKEQPSNSSFNDQAYTLFENYFIKNKDLDESNWRYRATLFVQISNPDRIQAITSQINPYKENNNIVREDFVLSGFELESFVGMGKRDSYDEVPGTWTREGSPIAAVIGTGLMGILILLIACFNLTNTSIAISSRRLKEIGLRKVMGGERKQLIAQFLGETWLICLLSLLLGVVIAETLLVPAFNELWPEMKITTSYIANLDFTIFLILTLLLTGLLAGGYPAFYISKFQPVEILKGKLKFGGTNYFTRVLLTLQFAISLIGIVCSFAFVENAEFQKEFDLGFAKNGVVYTYVNGSSEFEIFRNELEKNEDIIRIMGSQHHFYSSAYNDPIKSGELEIEVDILNVGDDYMKTVGLTLLEGRDFVIDSETDRKESVIVTEEVARKFGWENAVGSEIIWMDTVKLYVVGIIKNVYNNGMWSEFDPVMLRYAGKDNVAHVIVSAPPDKIVEVNKFMEATWKEIFPNRMYNGRYMDEEIIEATTVNINIVKMFVFLGIVALILSATGLFTLVSLNIIKKMKEIGVRKVMGATVANISKVVNLEFAIIMLIACILGSVLGSLMAGMLMGSIWDYYLPTTAVTLIVSSLILIVVAVVSVGYKTYTTARMNPVKVLRDE